MSKEKHEKDRVAFIEDRDGEEAAVRFAEQTAALYVIAALENSPYKKSVNYFLQYIEEKTGARLVHIGLKSGN